MFFINVCSQFPILVGWIYSFFWAAKTGIPWRQGLEGRSHPLQALWSGSGSDLDSGTPKKWLEIIEDVPQYTRHHKTQQIWGTSKFKISTKIHSQSLSHPISPPWSGRCSTTEISRDPSWFATAAVSGNPLTPRWAVSALLLGDRQLDWTAFQTS